MKTNRLLGSVDNTPLRRRDKALSFGPFELVPGMLNQEIWRKVAERRGLDLFFLVNKLF